MPYCEANKNALGLPKRLNTDFEESIARVSLDEIYQLILDDLEIAAVTPDKSVNPNFPWRICQATVNALLSRVYLTMGNYKEAQATAEKALEGAPELLILMNWVMLLLNLIQKWRVFRHRMYIIVKLINGQRLSIYIGRNFFSHVLLMRVVNGLFHLMI